MYRPLDFEKCKELYLHPLELEIRDEYLKIVRKHGNGRWAFDELEWKIYVDGIDKYESMSEDEKFIINLYMMAFRSLYK